MTTNDLSRWFAGILRTQKTERGVTALPDVDATVRAAVDALPIVLFEIDAKGIYTCVAGGLVGLFGITPELLLGRSIFEFPRFVPGKNVMVRRALAGEPVTFTGIWPRGRYMVRFEPRFDGTGRVSAVVALGLELAKPVATDKHFEELLEALRQSEARFRAMCDCAPLGICVTNPQLQLGYVNPALCALLAMRPTELLGRNWETLLPDAERARLRFARDESKTLQPEGLLQFVRGDGASVWVSLRMSAMHDEGELLGYVAVVADVTRERAARLAIDGVQQDLRRVIEGSPEGIAVVRAQRWVFVNRALVQTLGHDCADALLGNEVTQVVHPDECELAIELLTTVEARPADGAVRELRVRSKNGDYVHLELRLAPLSEFEGAPAILVSTHDVTEQKKLQARLSMTERLLAVGTLAAGAAHEINNPLSAVLSNLEWVAGQVARLTSTNAAPLAVREQALALQRLVKPIDEARDACGRVRGIVQDLKLLSRADEEAQGPVELTAVIDAAVRMAWNELRHRARLVREYGDLPLVLGNEARLAQVFLNLLINALQAIPEGNASAHEIRVTACALPAGQVSVAVRDTGSGIPESILGRIFDPFFTTKPAGVGTGLGLSICQRIVTSMGGQIEVESKLGQGSVFRVMLVAAAAANEAAPPEPEPAPEPAVGSGRGRLLIIDDDAAVGAALKLVLSEEHDVTVCSGAAEALERLHAGERYDVILCDLMMPELSGMDFHSELMSFAPRLAAQVIFLTGGAFTLSAREFLDRVGNPRLSKPFNWSEMRALITRQLSALR